MDTIREVMQCDGPRFWFAGGNIWQRSDLAVAAITPEDALVLAQEFEIGERECRKYSTPIMTLIADLYADWRRELAAVWAEYAHQGGEL